MATTLQPPITARADTRGTTARPHRPCVLHVLEATSAGAARYVADVLLNIDTSAFDVSFACSLTRSDERFRSDLVKIRERGVAVREIPMAREINPAADVRSFMSLRRMIGERSFDLVHGHSSKAGFLARLAARSVSRNIVTVYSPHAIAISLNPKYRHLERFAGLFTDAMLGVSRSESAELAHYGLVPKEKLCHVTAAVDVNAYRGPFAPVLRERYGVPKDSVLIGTAGRMSRQKDPLTFIEIARIVASTEPKAYFVWIGDGELREQVVARAEQAGIAGRLILPGYSPDIRPWLASLDIFLLTSLYESFGYVTCEAMALGKPVVATRVAGSVELVSDGENGFLGTVATPESLAPWVTLLARDSDLRSAMGQSSRQRVETLYNLTRMTNDLENLYHHLLSRKGRRR